MKRLCGVLLVLCLLASCASGDYYANSLTFLRRWNSCALVKDSEWLKIDRHSLWFEELGDTFRYAIWLEEDVYLLVLTCEKATDNVLTCSLTAKTGGERFYQLTDAMIRAYTDKEFEDMEIFYEGKNAAFHEKDFYFYSQIIDDFGITFAVQNLRIFPKEEDLLTLIPTLKERT
ncbi:MAG: hypothetical protein FWG82_02290 [Oscillospiraceae bacterium]|nr:hypothetical protein [Oscillospiraceae bacterium]